MLSFYYKLVYRVEYYPRAAHMSLTHGWPKSDVLGTLELGRACGHPHLVFQLFRLQSTWFSISCDPKQVLYSTKVPKSNFKART